MMRDSSHGPYVPVGISPEAGSGEALMPPKHFDPGSWIDIDMMINGNTMAQTPSPLTDLVDGMYTNSRCKVGEPSI